MIEDVLINLILLTALVLSFVRVKIAAVAIVALSVSSFHKFSSGLAADVPWVIAFLVPLVISIARDSIDHVKGVLRETAAIWVFFGVTLISTAMALDFSISGPRLWEFTKLLASLTIVFAVMRTRTDIEALIIVMAFFLALYGCVLGPYLMLTSSDPVAGPDDTLLADNNNMATALVMAVPLLYWLARSQSIRWITVLLYVTAVLTCVSVLGTYSRGGFIALCATLALLSLLTQNKWVSIAIGLVVLAFAVVLMPENFFERMTTVLHYQEDTSATGRIDAWKNAIRVAIDRPFGGGYEYYQNAKSFGLYSSVPPLAAHSIYFQVLGEHGFLGLLVYLYILAETLVILIRCLFASRRAADEENGMLSVALLASFGAFLVAGAFLSLAYWDGAFLLVFLIRMLAVTPIAQVRPARVQAVVAGRHQRAANHSFRLTSAQPERCGTCSMRAVVLACRSRFRKKYRVDVL